MKKKGFGMKKKKKKKNEAEINRIRNKNGLVDYKRHARLIDAKE